MTLHHYKYTWAVAPVGGVVEGEDGGVGLSIVSLWVFASRVGLRNSLEACSGGLLI